MTKLLILLSAACMLPGCTAMTVADLAGRALLHPGLDTLDVRGGKLYESPDLRMRFRPVRAAIDPEVRDGRP